MDVYNFLLKASIVKLLLVWKWLGFILFTRYIDQIILVQISLKIILHS